MVYTDVLEETVPLYSRSAALKMGTRFLRNIGYIAGGDNFTVTAGISVSILMVMFEKLDDSYCVVQIVRLSFVTK
jgi:hypothetical protein